MRALALLALASAAARCAAAPQPIMFAGPSLGGGVPVEVHGAPLWRLDRAFQRTCVAITCSGSKKYEAFEGLSREDVVTRMAESTLGGHRGGFCISPFGTTYIALRPASGGLWSAASRGAAPAGDYCEAHVSARFSNALAALAAAGALLFLSARPLSQNALFRVSSGGTAVSALALAAIFLFLTRPLWRRNTRVLIAFSGASLGCMWQLWAKAFALQSWHSIITSRYVLAYVGITFAIGAAATHILDTPGGPHRERVTGAFEALLRAIGLVAVCVGVQDWHVGGVAAAALLGYEATQRTAAFLRPLLRWLPSRRQPRGGSKATAVALEPEAPRAGRTPRPAVQAEEEDDQDDTPHTEPDCPIVRKGMALSPLTDKLIKIGGPVYNKLVATEGYVLNRSTGEMEQRSGAATAPPGARRGGDATTPGSAVAPRRLERAMEDESPPAMKAPGGGAGRGTSRFASNRSPSPPGRKPRAEAAGRSPPPAARRRSGRA